MPKGENDIRVVYDASQCGLNERLWAPNFILPSIDMALRAVDKNTWLGDADVGEMFLNFQLDKDMRRFARVDCIDAQKALWKEELEEEEQKVVKNVKLINWLRKKLKKKRVIKRWN